MIKTKRSYLSIVLLLVLISLITIGNTAHSEYIDNSNNKNNIDLNFNNLPLEDAFRAIAAIADKNIIIDSNVDSEVSIHLRNLTYLEAVESLAISNNLEYVLQNGVLFVGRAEDLKERFNNRVTRVYDLNHAQPDKIKESINLLVDDEAIRINEHTNSIVVTAYDNQLSELEELITNLDREKRQVMIQTRIQEISLSDHEAVGFNWEITGSNSDDRVELMPANTKISITNSFELDRYLMNLDMMEESGRTEIIANPRISTLDGETAQINIGDRIPIIQIQDDTTTIDFEDAGTNLEITPRITDDNRVLIDVIPEVNTVTEWKNLGGYEYPVIDTRRAETQVRVQDGKTAIIGGLIDNHEYTSVRKVPFLGDLPVVGRLFRHESLREEKSEIVIFITPRIIEDGEIVDMGESGWVEEMVDGTIQDFLEQNLEIGHLENEIEGIISELNLLQEDKLLELDDEITKLQEEIEKLNN